MQNWFTVEEIDKNTFAISEYKHWEESHSYLVCGQKRSALIDTGLGVSNIKTIVDSLTNLPVTVLTTHAHWDHIGGHSLFDEIFVHEKEFDWLAHHFPLPLSVVKSNLLRDPCEFPQEFDPDAYQIFCGHPQMLHHQDRIFLGGRTLVVLHTPGHSPGHCCFYEPEREYLYSGDLIYSGCLDAFYPTTDPMLFFQSLKSLQTLHVQRILPGHHRLNLSPGMLKTTYDAFEELYQKGLLKHGSGLFEFDDFEIHI